MNLVACGCLDCPRCGAWSAWGRLNLVACGCSDCPRCGAWSACAGGCGACLLGRTLGRNGRGAGVGRGSERVLLHPASCWGGRVLGRDGPVWTTSRGRSRSSSLYPVSESDELEGSSSSRSCTFWRPGVRVVPGAQRQVCRLAVSFMNSGTSRSGMSSSLYSNPVLALKSFTRR